MDLRAVVGKVRKDNTQIDKACEDTGAETPDRRRRDFSQIQWRDDGRLADAQTGDEAACIDGAQTAIVAQEDGNAQDPKEAELARSPDTADAVADEECTGKKILISNCLFYKFYRIWLTHKRAPPTEPIWTMADTLALMLAFSTVLYESKWIDSWKFFELNAPDINPHRCPAQRP